MMRYRTRGSFSAPTTYIEYEQSIPSGIPWRPTGAIAQVVGTGKVETMFDVVTPRYRSKSAKGEVIFNPMQQVRNEVLNSSGGTGYHLRDLINIQNLEYKMDGAIYPWFAQSASANLSPMRCVLDSDIEDAMTEVSTKLLSDRGRSNSNIYESLAEVNQTIGLVGSITENVNKVLKGIPSRKLAAISNLYLLARYGIRPLLGDLTAVVGAIGTIPEKVRQTTRASTSLSGSLSQTALAAFGIVQVTTLINSRDEVSFRAMSLDEYVATAASRAGFDVKGLYTLPWELVSLSFVADWFANIGDYIGALVPTPGVTSLGSCLVVERTLETSFTAAGTVLTNSNYGLMRPVTGSCNSVLWTKSRGSIATPGLVVKSDFKFSQLTRTLDALAVAQSRLRYIQKIASAINDVRGSVKGK